MRKLSIFILLAAGIGAFVASSLFAQTADDPNEGSKLEYDATNQIWRFKWWGREGHTYAIQHSEDLILWNWVPLIESGDDSIKEWGLTTTGDRFFMRLRYIDTPTTEPENDDFDGDGVSNLAEVMQGTNPFAWEDTDNDGLPDDWEIHHFESLDYIGSGDPDGDGLTNLQEFIYHTDPMDFGNLASHPLQDSDGNGLPDWWEILHFGTIGNNPNQTIPENGGLTLQQIFDNELEVGVSATMGDGIPDAWKIANGLNTTDPSVANQDPDNDALTNAEEYEAGTYPHNPHSDGDTIMDGHDLYPLVADPSTPGNFHIALISWEIQNNSPDPDWSAVDHTTVELRWQGSSNNPSNYIIERRGDNDLWQGVATVSSSTATHSDTGLVANRHYQYRIRAVKNNGETQVSSAYATASYDVPVNLRLHAKTAYAHQQKSYDSNREFTSTNSVPKYYLTKTNISSFTESTSSSSTSSSGSGNYSFTRTYNPSLKKVEEIGSFSTNSQANAWWEGGSSSSTQTVNSNFSNEEQQRRPGVLTSRTERLSIYDTQTTSSGSDGSSSSSSAGHDHSYILEGTYSPTNGPALWTVSDFDFTRGTISYSGSSTSSMYNNPNSGNNTTTSGIAEANGTHNPQWSGTYTNANGNSTQISYAPYSDGWTSSSWFYSLQSTTPTQKTYSQTSGSSQYQGTQILSSQYTTSALISTAFMHISDYLPNWTEDYWGWGYYDWGYWGPYDYWGYDDWYYDYGSSWRGWYAAHWSLDDDEAIFTAGRFKYKLSANPSAPFTMRWAEIFVPHDDYDTPGIDESLDIQVVATRTWLMNGSGNDSPEFEIDPEQHSPSRNGYYTILIRPVSMNVIGIGQAGKDVTGDDANPGKVVLINDGDADQDGIPDYADGYNLHTEIESDDTSPGASFIPIQVGFHAIDQENTKIKFTYSASAPTSVTRTPTNPYTLPTSGKIRLWMKDGWGGHDPVTYEYMPRDGKPIASGGDFIEPGVEYSLEDLGLANSSHYNSGTSFTIYAEVVKTSDTVADIPVKVEIKPNANLGFVFFDQIRFTGVATEIFSSSLQSDDFSQASMFSPSRFRLQEHIDNPTGNALPQTALFKIKITDPRSSINSVMIGQQVLPLSPVQDSRYVTDSFIFTTPGATIPSAFAQYNRLLYADVDAVVDYNPPKSFSSIKFPELPKEMQQTYSDMQRVAKQMHDAGWQPPVGSEGDNGIFGKELHRNMSQEYTNKRGKLPDVWLDADGKVLGFDNGYNWRPPGSITGTTQIDLLIVKGGYKPTVGRVIDRTKVISAVDFKSCGRTNWTRINDGIALRIKTHTGLDLWAPVSEYRYNFTSQATEAGKNIRRTTKLLKGVNIALPLATLMALPHISEAMDNAVDATQAFVDAQHGSGGDEFQSQLEMALSIREILSLLSLSPIQEYGNYYASLSLAVLDVAQLFEHDPEYD